MSVVELRGPVEVRVNGQWVQLPVLWTVPEAEQSRDPYPRPTYLGFHDCRCGGCDPELRGPQLPTRMVGYFQAMREPRLRVFYDDHEWPHVLEVLVGIGGWALVLCDPSHSCDCSAGGLCVYKIRGDRFAVRGVM